jgi:hypothetical protein
MQLFGVKEQQVTGFVGNGNPCRFWQGKEVLSGVT